MTQLWLPGAEHRAQSNGGSMVGGPPRAVWHITWDQLGKGGAMPSFDAVANYLVNVGYAPHLMWDPWSGRIVQFYPSTTSARALQHLAGGVETNRMGSHCLQVEAWFSPGAVVSGKRYATLADTPCVGIDRIVAWMRANGIPDTWPGGWPQWTGNSRSTTTWRGRAGHYGHCHIPENDHTDPGPMPRGMFAPVTPPAPAPATTKDEDMPNGTLLNGAKAATPISLHRGGYTHIGFIAADTVQGLPPASLNVGVHDQEGWHWTTVKVSGSYGQPIDKFGDAATTNGVIVQRMDAGDVNVAYEVS